MGKLNHKSELCKSCETSKGKLESVKWCIQHVLQAKLDPFECSNFKVQWKWGLGWSIGYINWLCKNVVFFYPFLGPEVGILRVIEEWDGQTNWHAVDCCHQWCCFSGYWSRLERQHRTRMPLGALGHKLTHQWVWPHQGGERLINGNMVLRTDHPLMPAHQDLGTGQIYLTLGSSFMGSQLPIPSIVFPFIATPAIGVQRSFPCFPLLPVVLSSRENGTLKTHRSIGSTAQPIYHVIYLFFWFAQFWWIPGCLFWTMHVLRCTVNLSHLSMPQWIAFIQMTYGMKNAFKLAM